ncbi:hypothetical protein FISHEDRAFT_68626, partial [Fistulina hepatica ATCC 64428]
YNPLKNIVVTNLAPLLDSHGYADGVKPPHKLSKANVLLKATEYILVLKRREARLERERDGLKSLVNSLVGGPVLLSEWQREWELVWGNGEDKSEGIYDNPPAFLGGEDSDGDDSGGEGTSTTRKKRARIEVPATPAKERPPPPLLPEVVLPDHTTVREKRKHSRPHKTPLPAPKVGLASPVVPVSAPAVNWPLFEQPSPLSVDQPALALEQALTAVLNSSGQSLQALTPQQLQALTLQRLLTALERNQQHSGQAPAFGDQPPQPKQQHNVSVVFILQQCSSPTQGDLVHDGGVLGENGMPSTPPSASFSSPKLIFGYSLLTFQVDI